MASSEINPLGIPLDTVLENGLTMGESIARVRAYGHEVSALEGVLTKEQVEQVLELADRWACLPYEALSRALAQAAAQQV